MTWLFLAGAIAVAAWSGTAQDGAKCPIDSAKIGIGAAATRADQPIAADVERIGAAWAYDWRPMARSGQRVAERGGAEWVPMIWGRRDLARIARVPSGTPALLGFNEPDERKQAAMSVSEALAAWPRLMRSGHRLGSPAPSQKQALGAGSWLGRFMAGVSDRGYRVDFVAVHYYSTTGDVGEFRDFLQRVHAAYDRPIWVTEWALADWDAPERFTAAQQAAFAREAILMMDALPWIERHAWFSLYDGADGWHLRSHLIDGAGRTTKVGEVFAGAAGGHVSCLPT